MPKHVLTIACACLLTVQTGTSLAVASRDGIVLETTLETIKIEEWGKTYTFMMSNELQTNTETDVTGSNARLKDVKKGDKVSVDFFTRDGVDVFTGIWRLAPTDAGMVTEVGKDTLTIRNDKGDTTFYKVKNDVADNSRDHYSSVYPSRFSEVTVGCRVEIIAYKFDGEKRVDEMVVWALDVKKDKGKDK